MGNKKVLIVDDSQTNLTLLDHLLAEDDCEVIMAKNGIEAIELVRQNEFALILLDIQMPGMNGYETAMAIKEMDYGRHVPIIFITAIYQDQENVKQGYASGAVDYLFRPVDVQTLKSKVQIFLQMYEQKLLLQREIAERKKTEMALRKAEEKYRNIFERAVEGIFRATIDGTIVEANPALVRILGYNSLDEVVGQPGIGVRIMYDTDQRRKYIETLMRDGVVSNFEYRARRGDGKLVWISESSRVVPEDDGTTVVEGVLEDITRGKNREDELRHLATIDNLTGVPNRHLFFDRLEHGLASCLRYDTKLAVLFVDLNDFKMVNDNYGHSVGDEVLRMVAHRILRRIRAADTLGRIGGDEFGVLLERLESDESAGVVAENILSVMSEPFIVDGNEFNIGVTIGISICPQDGDDPVTLLSKADSAMYSCKKREGEKRPGFAYCRIEE